MVRTKKVSSKIPIPITKPACTTVPMLENRRPHIEAAKIRPAAVITPPATGYQSRTFGFMSERLFTIWVAIQRHLRPDLRIVELPLMFGNFTAI